MKRAVQTVLVLVAVVCSLVLSGTATVALAASAKVPGFAQPAAIGVIEVVLATGTWIWVTDRELRKEAAAAVVLASVVSAYAGVHAFGAFGLIGPAASLVTTHLVARSWATTSQRPAVAAGAAPAPSDSQAQPEIVRTPNGGHQPVTDDGQNDPDDTPGNGQTDGTRNDNELIAELRRWIAEDGKMPGRDAVKTRFGVGSSKANKLRDAAAGPPVALAKEVS